MEYQLVKNIKEHDQLRNSFINLAKQTFGLSFEEWYDRGFWTDAYIPYVITDGERVLANVSVNRLHVLDSDCKKQYIQLGTVMTDPEYRGKGFSKRLMDAVLKDWKDRCDAIYLYANDTAVNFYPRFGFVPVKEYQCRKPITPKQSKVRKLDMDCIKDRVLLKQYYEKSNPFSELSVADNYGLLMFYCISFVKDCVYYLEDMDAVVIAEYDTQQMTCFDIFCDDTKSMGEILTHIAREETNSLLFGFSPKDKTGCLIEEAGGEETPFVLAGKENPFDKGRRMFPLLSHT